MRHWWVIAALAAVGCGETTCADEDKIFGWVDADGDGFGDVQQLVEVCALEPGVANNPDDCNDANPDQFPFNPEVCDGLDNDCDGRTDERMVNAPYYPDADGDGFGSDGTAIWACAPPPDTATNNQDCDDTNPDRNPGAEEVCDTIDNDCDGLADDQDPDIDEANQDVWYADQDGDTFGDPNNAIARCVQPASSVTNADDCNDLDPSINPNGIEVCNGQDDQCDGLVDDDDPALDPASLLTYYADQDGDGLGDPATTLQQCALPVDYVRNDQDCDDTDGLIRGPDPYLADLDGDGYGAPPVVLQDCNDPGPGFALATLDPDCDDADPTLSPGAAELCDSVDNDCDGLVDDADPSLDPAGANLYHLDLDQDGYGDPLNTVSACVQLVFYTVDDQDCDDGDAQINPDGDEVCDGIDNNCDTLVDDADPTVDPFSFSVWYADVDADGFGDLTAPIAACDAPIDHVADDSDCDDADVAVGAPVLWYADNDLDGVGAGPLLGASCTPPVPGAAPSRGVADCDDSDSSIFPGQLETCADGIDSDCNGVDDCPLLVEDFESGILEPLVWTTVFGEVAVVSSPVWDGVYSGQLGGMTASMATGDIDTTACTSVTWSFWGRRGPEAPEAGDVLQVEWFDGSDWMRTHEWFGASVGDSGFLHQSGEILAPGALRPNFRLRISSQGTESGLDQFYVDDLIVGCPP